jgi:hypothetical protein
VIISWIKEWMRHVVHTRRGEEQRGSYRILVGKPEREIERDHLECVSTDGRIIVK